MGRRLYETEAMFRTEIDRGAERLRPELGLDLREVLYPSAGNEAEASARLDETAVAQPALFVTEYALACLWMAWGVRPEAMLGQSVNTNFPFINFVPAGTPGNPIVYAQPLAPTGYVGG